MENPNRIKPIFQGLQGILSQTPLPEKAGSISNKSIWEHYNQTIDELNKVTGENYDRFKVEPHYHEGFRDGIVNNQEYRSKLNDLIMRLHAAYFPDTQTPFSGSPSMVFSQSQQQSQTAQVTMVLEIQSLIDGKLFSLELDDNEKTLLNKIKRALPTIRSAVELVNLIIVTAKSLGIGVEGLSKIFGT